jgi:hypothetical protein
MRQNTPERRSAWRMRMDSAFTTSIGSSFPPSRSLCLALILFRIRAARTTQTAIPFRIHWIHWDPVQCKVSPDIYLGEVENGIYLHKPIFFFNRREMGTGNAFGSPYARDPGVIRSWCFPGHFDFGSAAAFLTLSSSKRVRPSPCIPACSNSMELPDWHPDHGDAEIGSGRLKSLAVFAIFLCPYTKGETFIVNGSDAIPLEMARSA